MGAVVLSLIVFGPFWLLVRVDDWARRRRAFRREWRLDGRRWVRRG